MRCSEKITIKLSQDVCIHKWFMKFGLIFNAREISTVPPCGLTASDSRMVGSHTARCDHIVRDFPVSSSTETLTWVGLGWIWGWREMGNINLSWDSFIVIISTIFSHLYFFFFNSSSMLLVVVEKKATAERNERNFKKIERNKQLPAVLRHIAVICKFMDGGLTQSRIVVFFLTIIAGAWCVPAMPAAIRWQRAVRPFYLSHSIRRWLTALFHWCHQFTGWFNALNALIVVTTKSAYGLSTENVITGFFCFHLRFYSHLND